MKLSPAMHGKLVTSWVGHLSVESTQLITQTKNNPNNTHPLTHR